MTVMDHKTTANQKSCSAIASRFSDWFSGSLRCTLDLLVLPLALILKSCSNQSPPD